MADAVWVQCQYRCRWGGLGLDNLSQLLYAAQAAFILDTRFEIQHAFPTELDPPDTDSPFGMIRDFATLLLRSF